MGWWDITYWRLDKNGKKITELEDVDLEHIATLVKEGYKGGEVNDEEVE